MPLTRGLIEPEPVDDEREQLLGFLGWKRAQVIATTEGLTDQQLRWTPDGRLLCLGGIVNHLTKVEWRWTNGRFLAQEFPARAEELTPDPSWTREGLVDAYRQRGDETDAIVRAADSLDLECLGEEAGGGPAHVLLGYDRPITLRWVVLHLIEETAHHAGHADSTRELLDGKKQLT